MPTTDRRTTSDADRARGRRSELCRAIARVVGISGIVLGLAFGALPAAAEESESDLARRTQNPIANLISVPFQTNTTYRVGPREKVQNVLNIQPVAPFTLSERWNLITRTIVPIVSQPSFVRGQARQDGIGNISASGFFSPVAPAFGGLIWGAGPVVSLPTASDERLGADQWAAGLTAVGLVSRGSIVAGALVNNVFSLEGRTSSAFLLQPFLSYNFTHGWYVTTSPIVTADWSRSDDAWLVPVGGGFGKVHRFGRLPLNLSAQVFYNAEKPEAAGDWSTRFQVQLLFPR